MLLIAIGHGPASDPYTCSKSTRHKTTDLETIDPEDPQECLDFICQKQNLKPEFVDEILVVYNKTYDAEAEVMHHYSAAAGDWQQ